MKQILLTAFLLLTSAYAESAWKLEEKSPLILSSHQKSFDGFNFASLYVSPDSVNEGESQKQYIQIGTATNTWWLSNTSGFYTIIDMKFVDSTHILIIQQSSTVTLSSLINIKTRKQQILSGGYAEYIPSGRNKGLFLVHGRKGYFTEGGTFWVDELLNKKGDLIEVLSKPKNEWGCISLRLILQQDKTYPLLRQSLDNCVYVER